MVVDDSGNYLSLVKPTPTGWTVQNISTKEERNLELLRDMVDMRFIGSLESEEEVASTPSTPSSHQAASSPASQPSPVSLLRGRKAAAAREPRVAAGRISL